jgi:methylglyoxal synthase
MTTKSRYIELKMNPRKRIALVAHDHKKQELIEWATMHRAQLVGHDILATGTTGRIIESELGIKVHRVHSGPVGGDQQIGARIAEGQIDCLIFFWDPIAPMPHDPDVKSLLRMAVVWNIPVACNRASADYIIQSPAMRSEYSRRVPDYNEHSDGMDPSPALPNAASDPLRSWIA